MTPYDPDIHHRHTIRPPGYDYATPGAYFVTMVAQGRECLFGDMIDGEMRLNDAGQMVERWWAELARKFPAVIPDEHAVMPNHFHGIVAIVGVNLRVGADLSCPPRWRQGHKRRGGPACPPRWGRWRRRRGAPTGNRAMAQDNDDQ